MSGEQSHPDPSAQARANRDKPLCVDLDGTLLKTDTLHELTVRVLKASPWLLFLLPFWLLAGKHVLKQQLASRCQLDPSLLPYNHHFLQFLRGEHQRGRALYLVTGAHIATAKHIADYLGIFAGVYATETHNLTGRQKAAALVNQFGERGFDYAGNDRVDLAVWAHADQSYLVNASAGLATRLARQQNFADTFDLRKKISPKVLLKAIRLHQWAKNALIFVPLLASHKLLDGERLMATLMAFVAFGCCASFSYILNDIGDLDADRKHHSKKNRPFASGALGIPAGLLLALLLLTASTGLALTLPHSFFIALVVYFFSTNAYTLRLKYVPVLDVAILAGLYTLRVVAGGFAASVPTSFWLLAFSCFIFFSLAIVKRVSELLTIMPEDGSVVVCRGYWSSDLPILKALGASSAMISVLVLALYINSPDIMALYESPRMLWMLCPVMVLWLGRVWLITGRGQMHDDPVVFALRDRTSWLLFGGAALLMVAGAQW